MKYVNELPWRAMSSVILGLLVMAAAGCPTTQPGDQPMARDPDYAFGFINSTDRVLNGVRVEWMSNGSSCIARAGILPPVQPGDVPARGGGKRSSGQPDPIPSHVTLYWTSADGRQHECEMAVASMVPDLVHFSGTIWFEFTSPTEARVFATPSVRDPEYSFGFYNATSQRVVDVEARWTSFGLPCTAVESVVEPDLSHQGNGRQATYQPDPIPSKVTLNWTTADGIRHEKVVDVATRVGFKEIHGNDLVQIR
jgi:hypothetical protein